MATTQKQICDGLKADKQTRCGFGASIFYDGKVYCGQHYKKVPGASQNVTGDTPVTEKGPYLLSKKKEEDAKPKKPAVTKKEDAKPAKKVVKKVETSDNEEEDATPAKKVVKKPAKKVETSDNEEEAEEEHEAGACCVKPGAKKTGAKCPALKKDKDVCGKEAQYGCKHGKFCGIHWPNVPAHKASGATSRKTKEIADDEQCECDTKAKSRCTRRAFGKNKDGKKACNSHGGPKKEDTTAAVTGKGAVSGAPSGPFAGADFLTLYVRETEWRKTHFLEIEHGDDDTCGHCDALSWQHNLIKLLEAGAKRPLTDTIMQTLIDIGTTPDGADFAEIHGNCALHYLAEVFAGPKGVDDGQTKWLHSLFARMAKQGGNLGSELAGIWKEMAAELRVEVESEDVTPKGSSTEGAALLSNKKPNLSAIQANLAKKKKDAEAKAAEDAKVVADEEPDEDEKVEEVAKAMEEQDAQEEEINLE